MESRRVFFVAHVSFIPVSSVGGGLNTQRSLGFFQPTSRRAEMMKISIASPRWLSSKWGLDGSPQLQVTVFPRWNQAHLFVFFWNESLAVFFYTPRKPKKNLMSWGDFHGTRRCKIHQIPGISANFCPRELRFWRPPGAWPRWRRHSTLRRWAPWDCGEVLGSSLTGTWWMGSQDSAIYSDRSPPDGHPKR